MYEFGETIGGLDRCYYFGYGKDLYHFDHFMGTAVCKCNCCIGKTHLTATKCRTSRLRKGKNGSWLVSQLLC